MRRAISPWLIAAALGLSACASTTFRAFETRGDGIFEGKGGNKSVQDGMDIWEYGGPPRRYRVVGVIEDQRAGDVMGRLRSDVVNKAREVGGQALIAFSSRSEVVGVRSTSGGPAAASDSTGTTSTPIRRNTTMFLVIQYVD